MNPLVTNNADLVSYSRLEIVILAFGLAMRDLWVIQFVDVSSAIPQHVSISPLPFSEYEQLSHNGANLLVGFEELYA